MRFRRKMTVNLVTGSGWIKLHLMTNRMPEVQTEWLLALERQWMVVHLIKKEDYLVIVHNTKMIKIPWDYVTAIEVL